MDSLPQHQIGARLRFARKAAGYTSARRFAVQHSIPESTYSQHETGKRALSVEMLLHYSTLLNTDPNWLLTGIDDTNTDYKKSDKNTTSAKYERINPAISYALASRILPLLTPLFTEHNIQVPSQQLANLCLELCHCFLRLLVVLTEEKQLQP